MKKFILYDERAVGNPDDAVVLEVVSSEEEARFVGKEMRKTKETGVWYEYDLVGNECVNGKIRLDLPPSSRK